MAPIYEYDVALSFAGEDREYVEQVAIILKGSGVKVFYDKFEEANLWGKDLFTYLNEIYKKRAKFTIMFISNDYKEKLWTTHERKSMQERAFKESKEYILPARFDDTEIPGLQETLGYINLNDKSPSELVDIILEKLDWKSSERWWGKWELLSNQRLYNGAVFISAVDKNGFIFDLYNVNGAHSGNVDGQATFISKNEAIFEVKIDDCDEEKSCKINFVRTNDIIQVTENFGCGYYHGMQSNFDGEYLLDKDIFFDLMLFDSTLSKLYECVKDEYWDKLLDCFSAIYSDDYNESTKLRIIHGAAPGMFTICEGLLVISEQDDIWGAFIYDEKVHNFSSKINDSIPSPLLEWQSNLNDMKFVQI